MGMRPNTIETVLARVDQNGPIPTNPSRPLSTGCWLWTGGCFPAGYGSVSMGNKTHLVHRVVYEALVGQIPEGLDLDHLCRVRRCCRPDHLEPVTTQVNIARQERALAPECKRGHLFTEKTTYFVVGTLQRQCKLCQRELEKARRLARRKPVACNGCPLIIPPEDNPSGKRRFCTTCRPRKPSVGRTAGP